MSEAVWAWLPEEALSDPGALAPLEEGLGTWSQRWFPDDRLRLLAPVFRNALKPPPPTVEGRCFGVHFARNGSDGLVARALGVDLARLEVTDDDRKIIDAFRDEMLGDLAKRLDDATGSTPAAASENARSVQIEVSDNDGHKVLTLTTSRAVLAHLRRTRLPERAAASATLIPMRVATAGAEISLAAHLGSARMPVSDARRLAPGDVIVLDRNLDEPIELTPFPDGPGLACGMLVDTASPRSLRLQPPSSRVAS